MVGLPRGTAGISETHGQGPELAGTENPNPLNKLGDVAIGLARQSVLSCGRRQHRGIQVAADTVNEMGTHV
jgi:hypothetical protein